MAFGILLIVAGTALPPSEARAQKSAPGAMYFCPNKTPDQQLSARPAPGCVPLVDKKEEAEREARKEEARRKGRDIPHSPSIKIENLEREISSFLADYRTFLGCCLSAPDALESADSLEDRAANLLKNIQGKGLANMQTSQRGMTLSQLLPPVAQAKADLQRLSKKLRVLGEGKDRLGELDYESAGRERRRIQEEEDALSKEFRATVPPDAARTGTGIGNTTVPNRYGESAGDTILRPSTGSDIAGEQEQSLRPRAGMDTQSSTLTPRHGSENQDTTLPSSTGFEAGGAQGPTGSSNTPTRAGPNIGDSNLNQSR